MGRGCKVGKLPGFCLNSLATRVLARSPPLDSNSKAPAPAVDTEELNPKPSKAGSDTKAHEACRAAVDDLVRSVHPRAEVAADEGQPAAAKEDDRSESATTSKMVSGSGRVVVVFVDASSASKGALMWALSHAVQNQDTLVLLTVIKSTNASHDGDDVSRNRKVDPRSHPVIFSTMNLCQTRKPGVQVQLSLVEGRDKGPAIVDEACRLGASLLVLGQKRRSVTWRLLLMWVGNRRGGRRPEGVVDYCIQNAACMTVAVRRRSRSGGGGYLITTRRHKDFWLLA